MHGVGKSLFGARIKQSVASLTLAEKLRLRARGGESCGGFGRSACGSIFPLATGVNYSPGAVAKYAEGGELGSRSHGVHLPIPMSCGPDWRTSRPGGLPCRLLESV